MINAEVVVLTRRHMPNVQQTVQATLALTAEERQKSRYRCKSATGEILLLSLSRGTALADGDLLTTETGDWWARVEVKAEPIMIVKARNPLDLLRAAYHLGNRHVPIELTSQAIKLSADSVLQDMLMHQGLVVTTAMEPFSPEAGAYRHH
jgi:urease accessory protein